MLSQGSYLAHLTRLTSLRTLLERDDGISQHYDLRHGRGWALELATYPTSLRRIEFLLADTVVLCIQSYPTCSHGAKLAFRAVKDDASTSVEFSNATGYPLAGQHVELGTHALTVHVETSSAAVTNRSVTACLLQWMSQSGAQSVKIQPPVLTGFGRAMALKGFIENEAYMQHIVQHKLQQDLSRDCEAFQMTCATSDGDNIVELRRIASK